MTACIEISAFWVIVMGDVIFCASCYGVLRYFWDTTPTAECSAVLSAIGALAGAIPMAVTLAGAYQAIMAFFPCVRWV